MARGIALRDSLAYVAASNAPGWDNFWIVDVSDEANPTVVGSTEIPNVDLYDVVVSGDYAYAAACTYVNGIYVLNIAEPTNPVNLAGYYFPTPEGIQHLAISRDLLFASSGLSQCVWILDISNPLPIDCVSTITLPTTAGGIFVRFPYLFATARFSGLFVFDVSDPAAPVQVAELATTGYDYDIEIFGSRGYVTTDSPRGIQIVDVSDPAAPTRLGRLSTRFFVSAVSVDGGFGYLAGENAGLQIADLGDPTNAYLLGGIDTDCALEVRFRSYLAFLGDRGGLRIAASQCPIPSSLHYDESVVRPHRISLYPNPSTGATYLDLGIARSGPVRVKILDATGRLIRSLYSCSSPSGMLRMRWDGNRSTGYPASSGVYYVRLETNAGATTTSLVLVR
jgi:hypothetical protein